MLAANVRETTTTTGTGNITLAGASEDGRTFTSQYALNDRFPYYIDDRAGNWEGGEGYLTSSSVLVRETVKDSSTGSAINFSAGTKQVFVAAGVGGYVKESTGFSSISGIKFMKGANCIRPNTTHAANADRLHYVYFVSLRGVLIDSLAVAITTAGGTAANKMHLGLYDIKDGNPHKKIASVVDLDPSVTGVISGTFTELFLQPGLYYVALWCDVAITVKATDGGINLDGGTTVSNDTNLQPSAWKYNNSQVALSDLPDIAAPSNEIFSNASIPIILLGHT